MTESPAQPWISILVPTWNCADQLRLFLDSLLVQTYRHWELLLLDNASSDQSEALVRQVRALHPDAKIEWSSQPDRGIYDAWNRGLSMAMGRYVCCIGADDTFVDCEALARIAQISYMDAELITARNAYFSVDGRFLRNWGSAWGWTRMRQSMNIAHPGMLVRRDLFERYGSFDSSFSICADYEWFLRLPSELRAIHTTDLVLNIVQGGVSHTRIRHVYWETLIAQKRHLGFVYGVGCWCLNWIKFWRRRLIGLA